MLAEHSDVLAKLKMQVRDIKVRISLEKNLFSIILNTQYKPQDFYYYIN